MRDPVQRRKQSLDKADRAVALALGNLKLVCNKHHAGASIPGRAAELCKRFIQKMYENHKENGTPLIPHATGRGAALAFVLTAYGLRGDFQTIPALARGEKASVVRDLRKFYFKCIPDVLGWEEVRNADQRKGRPVLDLINRFAASRKMHLDPTNERVLWAANILERGTQHYERAHDYVPSVTAAAILYWATHRLSQGNDANYTLETLSKEWNVAPGVIKAACRDLDGMFRRQFANWERLGMLNELPEQDREDKFHNAVQKEKIRTMQTYPALVTQWTDTQRNDYQQTWDDIAQGESEPSDGNDTRK